MEQRITAYEKAQGALKAMYGLGVYLAKSKIEKPLQDLVCYRVSQINGCSYCLDMHSKDLRADGETEQRLYVLDAWRESPSYARRSGRRSTGFLEVENRQDARRFPNPSLRARHPSE